MLKTYSFQLLYVLFTTTTCLSLPFTANDRIYFNKDFSIEKLETSEMPNDILSNHGSWRYRVKFFAHIDGYVAVKIVPYINSRENDGSQWKKKALFPFLIGEQTSQLSNNQLDVLIELDTDRYSFSGEGITLSKKDESIENLHGPRAIFSGSIDPNSQEVILMGIPFSEYKNGEMKLGGNRDLTVPLNELRSYISVKIECFWEKKSVPKPKINMPFSGSDFHRKGNDFRKIQESYDKNKILFVRYEADWCMLCQKNKKLFLEPDVIQILERKGILTCVVDMTNEFLAEDQIGKIEVTSVPTYLIYKPNNVILLLPSALSKSTLIEELEAL